LHVNANTKNENILALSSYDIIYPDLKIILPPKSLPLLSIFKTPRKKSSLQLNTLRNLNTTSTDTFRRQTINIVTSTTLSTPDKDSKKETKTLNNELESADPVTISLQETFEDNLTKASENGLPQPPDNLLLNSSTLVDTSTKTNEKDSASSILLLRRKKISNPTKAENVDILLSLKKASD
jgi:hypothetical protein